jgi:hypothetical protein
MGNSYLTQKSFTEYVNERLNTMHGFIQDGDDYEFLHQLYKRHPHYNPNIDKFHISPLAQGGQDVSRVYDGIYDKFSKHVCIREKEKSIEIKMKSLARELIRDQIKIARSALGDICELCQSTNTLEVDHYPVLFSKIFNDFGRLDITFNKETNKYDAPIEQMKSWVSFHHTNAKYRLLCGVCNKNEYWKGR